MPQVYAPEWKVPWDGVSKIPQCAPLTSEAMKRFGLNPRYHLLVLALNHQSHRHGALRHLPMARRGDG
jgi:hypothetical protein